MLTFILLHVLAIFTSFRSVCLAHLLTYWVDDIYSSMFRLWSLFSAPCQVVAGEHFLRLCHLSLPCVDASFPDALEVVMIPFVTSNQYFLHFFRMPLFYVYTMKCFPISLSTEYRVLGLRWKVLIHFEFIFMQGKREIWLECSLCEHPGKPSNLTGLTGLNSTLLPWV